MPLRDPYQSKRFSVGSLEGGLHKWGMVLLSIYLLAGLFYTSTLPSSTHFSDAAEYLKLSDNLVHGPGYSMDGVTLTASRPPGYAFFLSGIRVLGGGIYSFRVVQFLMLAATIILVYRLCSVGRMFGGLLVVTTLVICYPILFYISGTIYPQTLASFLFVLALTFTLADSRGLPHNLVAGFFYGALILVVPPFLFTMVVTLLVAQVLKLIRWRDIALILLAASLIVGAWTLRNANCFHRFVPIASNSGLNFLVGNNENAVVYEGAAAVSMEPYYGVASTHHWNEFEEDHYYWGVALSYLQEHPWQAFLHYLVKTLNFFNVVNAYDPGNVQQFSPWKQIVLAASYSLLLGLLAWRLFEIKRFPLGTIEKLFLIVYVLSAFTSAIFLTRIRLRLPYDYLLIAVIALHLSRRLEMWLSADRS
jgi:hypothetical protein